MQFSDTVEILKDASEQIGDSEDPRYTASTEFLIYEANHLWHTQIKAPRPPRFRRSLHELLSH